MGPYAEVVRSVTEARQVFGEVIQAEKMTGISTGEAGDIRSVGVGGGRNVEGAGVSFSVPLVQTRVGTVRAARETESSTISRGCPIRVGGECIPRPSSEVAGGDSVARPASLADASGEGFSPRLSASNRAERELTAVSDLSAVEGIL